MSIIRAPRPERNFYILDKRISENARLSWSARGLLIYLLGKPDNWQVSVEHLCKQTAAARIRTGRDGVYALLKELESVGYVRRKQKRSADGKGFGEIDYLVSEIVLPAQTDTRNADTLHADTAEPTLASTEEEPRIEEITKTESNNKANAEGALTRTIDFSSVEVPDCLGLNPQTIEGFISHRREMGKPLTAAGWHEVLGQLKDIWEQGGDTNEALSVAMAMSYAMPVDPTRGKDAVIARRQRDQQRAMGRSVEWAHRTQPPSRPDREGGWNAY
jgi:hypothetical protein